MSLKIIKETELINKYGLTKQTKYYEYNGRKFKIYFENSNGYCIGFNSKMCLSQYDPEGGKWNYLEDNRIVGVIEKYASESDVEGSLSLLKEFFRVMEDHLVTVYK